MVQLHNSMVDNLVPITIKMDTQTYITCTGLYDVEDDFICRLFQRNSALLVALVYLLTIPNNC
jgi:hypothetical protein